MRKNACVSDESSEMQLIPAKGENAAFATILLTFENLDSDLVQELLARLGEGGTTIQHYQCSEKAVAQLQRGVEHQQIGKHGLVVMLSYQMQHCFLVSIVARDLLSIAEIIEGSFRSLDPNNRLEYFLRKRKTS